MAPRPYRELALREAVSQLGVSEMPPDSNSGRKVQQYQDATSLAGTTGWPWCAAFVNWCYMKVGRPLKELNRSASVPILLSLARKAGWGVHVPAPGDVVCYDWDTLTGPDHGDIPDHVGIVSKIVSTSTFEAIEGNTAIGNDSNGGSVMRRTRNISMVEGFFRVPGHPVVQAKGGGITIRRPTFKELGMALRHKSARLRKALGHTKSLTIREVPNK